MTDKPTIPTTVSELNNDSGFITATELNSHHDDTKQDVLVSGTSIKTVNGESLLGEGNIAVSAGALIDDTASATDKTYSSKKIDNLMSELVVWKTW